jgi:hypothetical protein
MERDRSESPEEPGPFTLLVQSGETRRATNSWERLWTRMTVEDRRHGHTRASARRGAVSVGLAGVNAGVTCRAAGFLERRET